MRHRAMLLSFAFVGSLLVGCLGSTKRVPLLSAAGIPTTLSPSGSIPLEVVTRGTGVPDPMTVRGSSVVYGDTEAALGIAVSSACVPWANEHRAQRPDGWQLFVELIQAEAEAKDDRLTVTLGVRATLRTRAGNGYLAQTQVHCRQAGLVAPENGGSVVYSCMSRVGRDLAGWLSGVQP